MRDWKSKLNGDPIGWLLEKDNQSVRYFTLTDILERPGDEHDARGVKKEIMKVGVAPKILTRQQNGRNWGRPESFHADKYGGTVWQLIVLAELGADGRDERIKKACDFILKKSQDLESGGFSASESETGGGSHDGVLSCLTGNMVRSLIRFGHLKDPRIQRGINWIVKYQRFDDGTDEEPEGWPYDRQGHPHCWRYAHAQSIHTCHVGVVKALKALAEIPINNRSRSVINTIENG